MDVRSLIMSTTLRWQAAIEQVVIEQAAIEQAAIDLLNGISASNAVDQNLYQDQGEFTNTLRSLLDRAGGGGRGGGSTAHTSLRPSELSRLLTSCSSQYHQGRLIPLRSSLALLYARHGRSFSAESR